ncbi:MAG: bile acid:sodium symporter [Phycisphaeraceae bacterium]
MTATATAIGILFIVASMAGIGLQVSLGELREALRARSFLGRVLAANFLIIPLVGVILARWVPMDSTSVSAFVLLACAAGGPSALQFTSKQRAALAYAGSTAFVLSLLAVFLSPLLMSLALPTDTPLVVPYARTFGIVLLLLVLPLGIGAVLRSMARPMAERLTQPVTWLGTLAFFGFVGLTLAQRRAATGALETQAMLAMLGFVVTCMAIGWLLGGPGRPTRRVLAATSSMRNVALCLAIARYSFPGEAVDVPLVAFSALMIPPNMLFFLFTLLRDRRTRS